MPFRDDDEAARARADALQVDLDRTREKLDEVEDDAEAAKRKLAETEARLRAAESLLAAKGEKPPDPPPTAVDAGAASPLSGLVIAVCAFGILFVLIMAAVRCRSGGVVDRGPPNPSCTLRTEPSGATIVALCHDSMSEQMNAGLSDAGVGIVMPTTFEMVRGTTPLTKSRQEWIVDDVICGGRMVARSAGLPDTPIAAPLAGMGCSEDVVHLGAEK